MFSKNSPLRFIFTFLGVYLILKFFVEFWIGLCAPGGYYWAFAEQHLNFVKVYREFLILGTTLVADLFGLISIHNSTSIRIIGHGGIRIVYSCIGYGIICLLLGLGIAFPYKSIKEKTYFIIIGFLMVSFLNMIRLFLVSYYARVALNMKIDHHDLFNWICYLLIFAFMYFWMKQNRPLDKHSKNDILVK